jgi:hypothetical protein
MRLLNLPRSTFCPPCQDRHRRRQQPQEAAAVGAAAVNSQRDEREHQPPRSTIFGDEQQRDTPVAAGTVNYSLVEHHLKFRLSCRQPRQIQAAKFGGGGLPDRPDNAPGPMGRSSHQCRCLTPESCRKPRQQLLRPTEQCRQQRTWW